MAVPLAKKRGVLTTGQVSHAVAVGRHIEGNFHSILNAIPGLKSSYHVTNHGKVVPILNLNGQEDQKQIINRKGRRNRTLVPNLYKPPTRTNNVEFSLENSGKFRLHQYLIDPTDAPTMEHSLKTMTIRNTTTQRGRQIIQNNSMEATSRQQVHRDQHPDPQHYMYSDPQQQYNMVLQQEQQCSALPQAVHQGMVIAMGFTPPPNLMGFDQSPPLAPPIKKVSSYRI